MNQDDMLGLLDRAGFNLIDLRPHPARFEYDKETRAYVLPEEAWSVINGQYDRENFAILWHDGLPFYSYEYSVATPADPDRWVGLAVPYTSTGRGRFETTASDRPRETHAAFIVECLMTDLRSAVWAVNLREKFKHIAGAAEKGLAP